MADRKDPLNAAAIAVRDQWLENAGILATSNYIVDETLTFIRMRIGLNAAKKWWTMVSKSPRCKMHWIAPEREKRAIQWFFDWQDQSFSFTDCTSFVVMNELFFLRNFHESRSSCRSLPSHLYHQKIRAISRQWNK